MEVKLRKGEGPRILAIVHPITNKMYPYKFIPGVSIEIPDELAKLVKDKRFKVIKEIKKIKIKTKVKLGVDNNDSK